MLSKYELIMLVLALCLMVFTCKENGAKIPEIEMPYLFEVPVSESVRIGTDLEVRFVKVLGDSRCPKDVTCIHAGEATVLIQVLKNDSIVDNFELTALNQNSSSVFFEGYDLHLQTLKPWPVSTKTIDPEEYIAVFKISKTGDVQSL